MDCLTRGKCYVQPGAGEEEKEEPGKVRKDLYLQVLSGDLDITYVYKIDPNEAGFCKELAPIAKLSQMGCGSVICDSRLYMFGGWEVQDGIATWCGTSTKAHYLPLDIGNREPFELKLIDPRLKSERAFPKTVTIGEKIYIFGSDNPAYGEDPSDIEDPNLWAEVFDMKKNTFKSLKSPPDAFFSCWIIGVCAVIKKKGGHEILFATNNFSDLFIYDVGSEDWEHKPTHTISPFRVYSVGPPVIGNHLFLYGSGHVCVFDKDKSQFLKNNLSLLDYVWFDLREVAWGYGAIHHLGGWKFCLVFSNNNGYLVTYLQVVSFEICDPEVDGDLQFKAGSIKVADYVLDGPTLVNSSLWSSQIVPSRNLNEVKQLHMNNFIIAGQSSVTSHVDDDCMKDYGATLKPGDEQDIVVDYSSDFSKLRRRIASIGKEIAKLKSQKFNLVDEFKTWQRNHPSISLDYLKSRMYFFQMMMEDISPRERDAQETERDELTVRVANSDKEEISMLTRGREAQQREIDELIFMVSQWSRMVMFLQGAFGNEC